MSGCYKVKFGETGRTAVGGVPASDRWGSTDIRERWEIPEDVVSLGQHAIGSIRARDRIERHVTVVIKGVIRDGSRADSERNSEESKDREEFHAGGGMKANRVVFVWTSCTTPNLSLYSFRNYKFFSEAGG